MENIDMDPQLQYWQDRADGLQWVIGSPVGVLDSIATRVEPPTASKPAAAQADPYSAPLF